LAEQKKTGDGLRFLRMLSQQEDPTSSRSLELLSLQEHSPKRMIVGKWTDQKAVATARLLVESIEGRQVRRTTATYGDTPPFGKPDIVTPLALELGLQLFIRLVNVGEASVFELNLLRAEAPVALMQEALQARPRGVLLTYIGIDFHLQATPPLAQALNLLQNQGSSFVVGPV
jgi:hypothetical protein